MASNHFQLKGVEELKRKLRKLRGVEVRRAIRQAVRTAAKPVRDLARQIAPHDTGTLRRNIKVRSGKRSKKLISALVVPGLRSQLGIAENSKGFYPTHVELGTKRKRKEPAIPYFRDAMKLQREESEKTIGDLIAKGIERAVQ